MSSPSRLSRYEKNNPNNETISIQKTSLQTSYGNLKAPKQCRICLQDETQSNNKEFINPCKCIGSVKYIHDQCMKKWIDSALKTKSREERNKIQNNGIQCEMCKYLVKFQIDTQYGCNNCQEIGVEVKRKIVLFVIVIVLFFVAASGLSFAIYSVLANLDMLYNKNGVPFEIILAICGATLLFLFFCLGTYSLINEFLLKVKFNIGKITQINHQLYRSKNQIMPIQDISQQQIQVINGV